jgi:hypothetical protein
MHNRKLFLIVLSLMLTGPLTTVAKVISENIFLLETLQLIKEKKGIANESILGKWKSASGEQYIIYNKGSIGFVMKITWSNGESLIDKLNCKKIGTSTTYNNGSSNGEYFIIEDNGNLGFYNKSGKKFEEAIKMK